MGRLGRVCGHSGHRKARLNRLWNFLLFLILITGQYDPESFDLSFRFYAFLLLSFFVRSSKATRPS